LAVVGFDCGYFLGQRPRCPHEQRSLPSQSEGAADELRDSGADTDPVGSIAVPESLPGVDPVRKELRENIGLAILSRRIEGGSGQRAVVGVGVPRSRDENLRRTNGSEKIAYAARQTVFMIDEFTIAEVEFEAIYSRYRQEIKSTMPFTLADLGDVMSRRARC
jgi:hypothetical protein